ncbi:MAG: redoxin domain-containing protein [Ignavibacteriaceae bacterium]
MIASGLKTGLSFSDKKIQSIEVKTTFGVKIIPDDYQQKWIVLLCHPGDFNLTCFEGFYTFAIKNEEFKKLNTQLIGLSIDGANCEPKCIRWIKQRLKMNIPFPIITDCLGDIEAIQALIHPANKMRVVSIIDMEGFIRLMIYYPEIIDIEADKILETLKDLQISENNKAAMMKNQRNDKLVEILNT